MSLAGATSLRSSCRAGTPSAWQSPQRHSGQTISNSTDSQKRDQKRNQGETTLRLRGIRPMGRSSKDTMESSYSARLPSSLSWRQNREDTSSSGNDRWAAPFSFSIGESLRFIPFEDCHHAGGRAGEAARRAAKQPARSEVAVAGKAAQRSSAGEQHCV